MLKKESTFRQLRVIPFLKRLKNTVAFPIQQIAICGTPDFLLCSHGMFVALELKAVDGVVSKLQRYNLDKVQEAHGVALVASPENWDSVKEILKRLDGGLS